jgi:hypothetical protein
MTRRAIEPSEPAANYDEKSHRRGHNPPLLPSLWPSLVGHSMGLRRRHGLTRFEAHRVSPHRLAESLQLLLAEALVCKRQPTRHRLIDRPLNAHPSSRSQLLETLRQHDTLTGDRVVRNHHLPETDANPKSWLNIVL